MTDATVLILGRVIDTTPHIVLQRDSKQGRSVALGIPSPTFIPS